MLIKKRSSGIDRPVKERSVLGEIAYNLWFFFRFAILPALITVLLIILINASEKQYSTSFGDAKYNLEQVRSNLADFDNFDSFTKNESIGFSAPGAYLILSNKTADWETGEWSMVYQSQEGLGEKWTDEELSKFETIVFALYHTESKTYKETNYGGTTQIRTEKVTLYYYDVGNRCIYHIGHAGKELPESTSSSHGYTVSKRDLMDNVMKTFGIWYFPIWLLFIMYMGLIFTGCFTVFGIIFSINELISNIRFRHEKKISSTQRRNF